MNLQFWLNFEKSSVIAKIWKKSIFAKNHTKLKNLQFCTFKNHQLYQNWKIFNFDHILKFWVFSIWKIFKFEQITQKSHCFNFAKIWKNINLYYNLKNLQFWPYFEKSSFFAKIWKIFKFEQILINLHFQFWLNFEKSSIFTKILIIINFYQNLKIFNLVLSLKKYCFSKIWKIINFYKNHIFLQFCQSLKIHQFYKILIKFWKIFIFCTKFEKSSILIEFCKNLQI